MVREIRYAGSSARLGEDGVWVSANKYMAAMLNEIAPKSLNQEWTGEYGAIQLEVAKSVLRLPTDGPRSYGMAVSHAPKGEDDGFGMTGKGGVAEVFGGAVAGVLSHIREKEPEVITYTAVGRGRQRFYDRLTKTILSMEDGRFAMKYDNGKKRRYLIGHADDAESIKKELDARQIKPVEMSAVPGDISRWETIEPGIDPEWFSESGWGIDPPSGPPGVGKKTNGVSKMSAAHAPKGGVTISGVFYPAGQFIPDLAMENATPEERAAVVGIGSDGLSDEDRSLVQDLAGKVSRREMTASQAVKSLKKSGKGRLGTALSNAIKDTSRAPALDQVGMTPASDDDANERLGTALLNYIRAMVPGVREDVLEDTDFEGAAMEAGHRHPDDILRYAASLAKALTLEADEMDFEIERRRQSDSDRAAAAERDEARRRDVEHVTKFIEEASVDAKRDIERGGLSRDERRYAKAASQMPVVHAAMIANGWSFEYMSEGGSLYYKRDGVMARVSDHEVPETPERRHASESGQFTWSGNEKSLVLPLDDDDIRLVVSGKW